MTTFDDDGAFRPTGLRETRWKDLRDALAPLLAAFRPAQAERRAAERDLTRLSDHLLRDIGLERMPGGAMGQMRLHHSFGPAGRRGR
jgi:uncharacterized protein YjiS (DUF1127 family)